MLKANKEYLKVLSGVELMNEYIENYIDKFSCYMDFLEWVEERDIRHY